jgi:hypothetical protein
VSYFCFSCVEVIYLSIASNVQYIIRYQVRTEPCTNRILSQSATFQARSRRNEPADHRAGLNEQGIPMARGQGKVVRGSGGARSRAALAKR